MPLHIHDVYATCLHIDTFARQGDIRDGYTTCAVPDCQECHFQRQCDSFDGYHTPKPAQLRDEAIDR